MAAPADFKASEIVDVSHPRRRVGEWRRRTRHALARRRGTHSRTDPRRPRPHAARSTRADDRSSTPPGRPREARAPDTRTRSFQPLISTPRAPGIITMRSEGVSTLERAAPPNLSTRSTRIHDRLKPSFLDTYTVSRDDLKRPTPSHRVSLAVRQISRPHAPRIPAPRRPVIFTHRESI